MNILSYVITEICSKVLDHNLFQDHSSRNENNSQKTLVTIYSLTILLTNVLHIYAFITSPKDSQYLNHSLFIFFQMSLRKSIQGF